MTASLSRGGAHHGARSLSTSVKVSGLCDQPAVQLLERQVDDPVVEVVAHHLGQQACRAIGAIGSSRKRGTKASLTRSAMWSSRTLPSAIAATSDDLVHHPPGVGGVGEPVADAEPRSSPRPSGRG